MELTGTEHLWRAHVTSESGLIVEARRGFTVATTEPHADRAARRRPCLAGQALLARMTTKR